MTNQSNDSPQPRGKPDHTALTTALQKLESTSRRSANEFSLKSYVRQYYNDLKAAHSKGHTWSALAQLIHSKLHVQIAAETLRKYMAYIRQEREEAQTTSTDFLDKRNTPSCHLQPQSKSSQRRDVPLAKNLQPSIDREFRRSHRRPES